MVLKQVIASPVQVNQNSYTNPAGVPQASAAVTVDKPINAADTLRALQSLSERLEILRTGYGKDGHGVLWQQVNDGLTVELTELDWQGLENTQIKTQQQLLNTPFKAQDNTQPWLHLTCAILPTGQQWLHLAMPTANTDLFSMTRLFEFMLNAEVQQSLLNTDEDELVQYEDLAEWLNSFLLDDELEQARAYWQGERLTKAFNDNCGLAHYQRNQGEGYGKLAIDLGELYRPLTDLALSRDASFSDVVCAHLRQSLARISGEGSLSRVMDSRNDEDLQDAIGPLSRALPVVVDTAGVSLAEQVSAERKMRGDVLDYVECFVRPVRFEDKALPFVFQSVGFDRNAGAYIDNVSCLCEQGKLVFSLVEQGDKSFLSVDFDREFIAEAALKQWLEGCYNDLAVASGVSGNVVDDQLSLAGPQMPHQDKRNVVAWFEQRLNQAQGKVISPDLSSLSLFELNGRANKLANHLSAQGVGRNSQVAIRLTQSGDFITAMLAIAKTGAAYIPIDTQLPQSRVKSMLDGPQVKMVIGSETIEQCPVPQLMFNQIPWDGLDDSYDSSDIQADDIAYVLYTSGSTGKAKGVNISHRALVNHMAWMEQCFGYQADDVFLQRTSVSFDASVWECWSPLLVGATMVVMDKEGNYDLAHMLEVIRNNQVSVLQMVPSQLEVLLEQQGSTAVDSLRLVFCGGEALKTSVALGAKTTFNCEVVNLYGPSECCIDSTYLPFDATIKTDYVPIGKPVDNVSCLVVKEDGTAARFGEEGELWLSGECLFSGYQAQPELTAKATAEKDGVTYYKTGDFVRILADGNLYFLERLDNQVKLNGLRIELEEISSLVENHAMAAQAVCVCDKHTVGLSLFVRNTDKDEAAIKQLLGEHLPEYMVPDLVLEVEEFPRLANGKIDNKALIAMAGEKRQVPYVAPSNETEQKLAEIWQECLGSAEPVGVNSDFFAIGGHSLQAIKVISRIVEAFGIKITVHDLFENNTISLLAERMKQLGEQQSDDSPKIVALNELPEDETEEFEL